MAPDSNPSRRQVIAVAGAGVGAFAVAGCGGGGESEGKSRSESKGDQEKGAAQIPPGETLANLDDLEVGAAKRVKAGDKQVIVTRSGDDTAVAFSAKCTHKGCTVTAASEELRCPCHQSRFDPQTGEVLGGPADAPLPKVDVHVKSGKVITDSD